MPDHDVDNFVTQLVASGGMCNPDAETRLCMARAQVKFALGLLCDPPNREMALVALLDAVDHLRALPRQILCNWCGKRHTQPAQNAAEALATCRKADTDASRARND